MYSSHYHFFHLLSYRKQISFLVFTCGSHELRSKVVIQVLIALILFFVCTLAHSCLIFSCGFCIIETHFEVCAVI